MVESQEDYTVSIRLRDSNKLVIIDEIDHHKVWDDLWCLHAKDDAFYARSKGRPMHRWILDGVLADHKDRDGLNNTRENLRLCSHSQNMMNADKPQGINGSGYRGVMKNGPGWQVRINCEGQRIYVGQFSTAIEAARAYDNAAKEHHGEFAVLNFPDAD